MVSQFVSDLYLPLSQVRLEGYRPQGGSDLDMVTNYFWNIALAEALVPSLHAIELAVRNSMHSALTHLHGSEMWFYQPGLLESGQLAGFAAALRAVANKPPPLAGRLVAELSFGFWVTLLSAPYEQRIWQPNNYALLAAVFPHATSVSRKQIHERLNTIRELRNRVFHYEPIWYRQDLLQVHTSIHEVIRWISATLHSIIHAVDTFPNVHGGRAQAESDIKSHLGIP